MESEIGKIKSLALKYFLTYDEFKYIPEKNLNIIIGPNGSGKSTIVAGIILGCGGKPSVLSRSKDISDYVKNGKNKAHIEIELIKNNDKEIITLHRSFDKAGKESFSIDGIIVTGKAYNEKVRSFNIQVDNLCMFLPQDQVQNFTKLNAQEILHNTQISVCSQEINDNFESLKKKREKQKGSVKKNSDLQIQLNDNVNRNEQLHGMIENSRLKDRLMTDIELYKKKKLWLEYDALKVKFDEADGDVKKLKESINNKNLALKPLEKRQSDISGTKNSLKNALSKSDTKLNQIMNEIETIIDASNNLESEIGKSKQNFKNIISTARNHVKEVQDLELVVSLDRQEYEEAQNKINEDGDYDQVIRKYDLEIKKYKSQIEILLQKMDVLNRNLDEQILPTINLSKRKIASMNDTQNLRFNNLKANFDDAYRAYEWLDANRASFRGHIFNPVITEISVKEKNFTKYLENNIGHRDLEAFLCTDKQDMQRLIKKFRIEMKLKVNVGFTEPIDELQYVSELPVEKIPSNLGIYAYLIDMIEGPAPVLNYLCSLYRLHNTAVGDDRTFNRASHIPNNIQVFFSTNHRFVVNVSKYTGKKSVSSSEIFPKNILNVGIDEESLALEQQNLKTMMQDAEKIKSQRGEIQKQIQQIEGNVGEIKNQKNQIITKIRNLKTRKDKLIKKEGELEKLKSSKINIEDERKKNKKIVDDIIDKILANNGKVIKSLEDYKMCTLQRNLAKKKLRVFDNSTGNVDEQIDQLKREVHRITDTLKRATHVFDDYKRRMNAKKEEALKETDGLAPNERGFKYTSMFSKLENAIGDLQDKIDEMQGRIECIRGVDPQIMAEYEERKEAIEELKHLLSTEQERAAQLENEIENLHNQWYGEIQKVVNSINENFSNYFQKMGFVGEVELIRKEERDYADYGIQIRVQYRDNEKLQALNRHVQSGGERAVAIAVYTLSLQHLTMVPFRCVDEINQGMDPKNERKIFQMLVDITCQPGQSQYFFVTPKLLPDLPYNDLMTVSVVHNGKHLDDPFVFMDDDDDEEDDEDVEMA